MRAMLLDRQDLIESDWGRNGRDSGQEDKVPRATYAEFATARVVRDAQIIVAAAMPAAWHHFRPGGAGRRRVVPT